MINDPTPQQQLDLFRQYDPSLFQLSAILLTIPISMGFAFFAIRSGGVVWFLLSAAVVLGTAFRAVSAFDQRFRKKAKHCTLMRNGVQTGESNFTSWDDVTQVRMVHGQIWIEADGKDSPIVKLDRAVIGDAHFNSAAGFIRAVAPNDVARKLGKF